MRQINFLLIFSFALAAVMFALENSEPTTVTLLPGVSFTLPLAVMLLVVMGVGATAAWIFAVWTMVVSRVETARQADGEQASQVRIEELERDLDRYRATVDAQLGLLPAVGGTTAGSEASPNPAAAASTD
ncbi:LapA family protein [Synechococcus sp. RSCCF101]|uniref:LapA family protein n=1 Tax=Synechococcus sp. RSCCF101 TaxID=2511069 RepID=UPI0012447A7E|nr:LapA family protein [Synechococcus sp. RSCCF101]QEY32878.1 LapA family protein [Synechococcus sp. RSCCF101]